jgi:hypothetical protein
VIAQMTEQKIEKLQWGILSIYNSAALVNKQGYNRKIFSLVFVGTK